MGAYAGRYGSRVDRRIIGSWLSGPRAAAQVEGIELGYPGQRLGLPEHGRGSVVSFPVRIGAVFVDWTLSLVISRGFLDGNEWATLAIFGVANLLLVSTLGAGVGGRLFRIRVARLDGGHPSPTAVLIRTVLLCLAIPPLIWDRDGRGLHDKAARTVVLRS
jgi:RDD family